MISKDEAKQRIVDKITELQGVKATHLIPDLDREVIDHEVPQLLEELVQEKRIVEICYVLPQMKWREKSFYLPIGTQITGIQNDTTVVSDDSNEHHVGDVVIEDESGNKVGADS